MGQKENQKNANIDVLIDSAFSFDMKVKSEKLTKISLSILKKSEEAKYDRGLAYGNYLIANAYYEAKNYNKRSIEYIKKSQSYTTDLPQDIINTYIYKRFGANYAELRLYNLAHSNYLKALYFLEKARTTELKRNILRSEIYYNISLNYSMNNKPDSAYIFNIKNKIILSKLSDSKVNQIKAYLFVNLGYDHLDRNNVDSASYYFNQAMLVFPENYHPYNSEILLAKSELLAHQKKYHQAIKEALAGLKIAENFNDELPMSNLQKSLQSYYGAVGDYENATLYGKKYMALNEKIEKANIKQSSLILNEIFQEEKREAENKYNASKKNILLTILLVILLISLVFYWIKEHRKKTLKVAKIEDTLLQEKTALISKQEKETQLLQVKVNESFHELIQLAKQDDPKFFTRFKEVYPRFTAKILEVNPKMRTSELVFCAYVFLGFSTKDIAFYTSKSVHTIHGKKSNFRKKFNLDAEEDLEIWLKRRVEA